MVVQIQYATPDQIANNDAPDRTWQFMFRKVGSTPPAVTFTVNTANINVGPNGIYLGGGVFGNAEAFQMSDADADGTYEVTVNLAEGTSGHYIF